MIALEMVDGAPAERRAVEAWTYGLAREAPSHAVLVTTNRHAGGGVVLQVDAKEVEGT